MWYLLNFLGVSVWCFLFGYLIFACCGLRLLCLWFKLVFVCLCVDSESVAWLFVIYVIDFGLFVILLCCVYLIWLWFNSMLFAVGAVFCLLFVYWFWFWFCCWLFRLSACFLYLALHGLFSCFVCVLVICVKLFVGCYIGCCVVVLLAVWVLYVLLFVLVVCFVLLEWFGCVLLIWLVLFACVCG